MGLTFCLMLPLLVTVGALRPWETGAEADRPRDMVPVLSLTERRKLLTFEQPCAKPEDCEPPLGCLGGFPEEKAFCMDSECTTDLQCEESFGCHALRTLDRTRFVRTCVPAGRRKEGEPCRSAIGLPGQACARGLQCNLFCGRPCVPGVPLTCPDGFFCQDSVDGASCLPTCERTGCPGGQECVPMGKGGSICTFVVGENCERTPCRDGSSCRVGMPDPRDGGTVTTLECVQRCGEGLPPCPEAFLCWKGSCRRSCDPASPDACGLNRACRPVPHEQRGICRLDPPE